MRDSPHNPNQRAPLEFHSGKRRRWSLVFATPLVLVAALLVAAGAAGASGTLDQSQTDASVHFQVTGPNNIFFGMLSSAQTFTAGMTGGLDRVDLYLVPDNSPTAPLTVEIRNTSSGQPGSTVLSSASVPASSVVGGWVEVDFASPAAVTSGTHYAIVASTADTGSTSLYFWFGSESDLYSGGSSWVSFPANSWSANPFVTDFAFKTYVAGENVSDLAAQLVADTDHLKPGNALASQAAAIQAAVNAGDTATACADITGYLGLAKAQTGKKLTSTQASLLTSDANKLVATLGC